MSSFFTETEAARRYSAHRPKTHEVIVEWLAGQGIGHVTRALDVACGTGDSTLPLVALADEVIGVDVSDAMLAHAQDKSLDVRRLDYSNIAELGRFDLITTCMAFHWFDPDIAVSSFKAASNPGAVWLIYNFFFAGHSRNSEFNEWLRDEYLGQYPSPPRNKTENVVPVDDPEISRLTDQRGVVPIELTPRELVDYLSTQTNIEEAVKNGRQYDDVCTELLGAIEKFDLSGTFNYAYTYELHRYTPASGGPI